MELNNMWHYIGYHSTLFSLIAYIFLSNAVNALPEPEDKNRQFYKWFFTFSHGMMLQMGRFANNKINGIVDPIVPPEQWKPKGA